MAYLTDEELLTRYEYYTIQLEDQLLNGQDFETISDQIPIAVHLNDANTLVLKKTNKIFTEHTGYSLDEILEMGMEYFDNHLHPQTTANVFRFLPDLYAEKSGKPFSFIQYVKLGNDNDYSPVITFTKSPRLPNEVIALSPRLKDFGAMEKKMEQVIEMDQFKMMHFKKFQQLTSREVEILGLLANGIKNTEIADQLFISKQTVETHRKHIKNKLGIRSFHDLIKYAITFSLTNL